DLDVERGDPATDGRLVMELLDRGELLLHLAEQLERWRQDRELLALDELLHPYRQVVVLIEIGKRLAGPRQVVEGALFPGDTDPLVDPRLPARSGRLALRHGAQLLARSIAPREQHRAVAQYRTRPHFIDGACQALRYERPLQSFTSRRLDPRVRWAAL